MPENPVGPPKKKYVRSVGPRLRIVLYVVFALVAVLGANSAYLGTITFLEWLSGLTYQNYFYQAMFLAHLALGLLFLVPFVIFTAGHIKAAYNRPNKKAVSAGWALFVLALVLLISGLILTRFGNFQMNNKGVRSISYWAHVISPLFVVWLYILHRLAGPRIKWKVGLGWGRPVARIV